MMRPFWVKSADIPGKLGWVMGLAGILFALWSLTACQITHSNPPAPIAKQDSRMGSRHQPKPSEHEGLIPSFFAAIKPKFEPLNRSRKLVTYRVAGRRYAVMRSAKGYKQRGLASWYGRKFHSHRTSSGEHYNMYALTAAHKTLPLQTYVRVKNLENGRVAIVKVNDRGPFHRGRLIDLSYGAAVKLGIFPKGTAQVEIEAISSA